jgi:hypothetical protein
MLMRWRRDMNLMTVESLRNIDQFAKQIRRAAQQLSSLLFGRSIGWVFGLLLTPDRGQMKLLSQVKADAF